MPVPQAVLVFWEGGTMITMLVCIHCDWQTGITQPPKGLDITLIHRDFPNRSILHEVVITYTAGFLDGLRAADHMAPK